jgi:hypothetical protein
MARARVKQLHTPRTICLELTEGEADFILASVYATGGDPDHSPRKYATRIMNTLEKTLGYGAGETDAYKLGVGGMHFRSYGAKEVNTLHRLLSILIPVGFTAPKDNSPIDGLCLGIKALINRPGLHGLTDTDLLDAASVMDVIDAAL